MEGTGWTRAAVALGAIAAAAIASIFVSHNYVGGPIVAAIFGAAAARCWYLGS